MRQDPVVTIVLPVFRATHLAVRAIHRLERDLRAFGPSWEVVVVDDSPYEIPPDTWASNERVRLIRHTRNQGKGAAVRSGMLSARGAVRIYTDVDLPYGTGLIEVIAALVEEQGYHLVIGDRTLPNSAYHQLQPWHRRLASSVFSSFVGRLVTGGFFDTQCGLKALRGDVADLIFPLVRTKRFAFDVELVYIALKFRLDIKRVPVRLLENQTSSVRVLRDGATALRDLARIKWTQLRGGYASSALEDLVANDFVAFARRIASHRGRTV